MYFNGKLPFFNDNLILTYLSPTNLFERTTMKYHEHRLTSPARDSAYLSLCNSLIRNSLWNNTNITGLSTLYHEHRLTPPVRDSASLFHDSIDHISGIDSLSIAPNISRLSTKLKNLDIRSRDSASLSNNQPYPYECLKQKNRDETKRT